MVQRHDLSTFRRLLLFVLHSILAAPRGVSLLLLELVAAHIFVLALLF